MPRSRGTWILGLVLSVHVACGGTASDESVQSAGHAAGVVAPPPRPGSTAGEPRLELRGAPRAAVADGPRAISPLSGARVGSLRPELRCAGAAVRVQLCADAACGRVTLEAQVSDGAARLEGALSAGRAFWRCLGREAASPSFLLIVRPSPEAPSRARPGDLTGDGLADVLVGFTRGPPPFDVALLFRGTEDGLEPSASRELPSRELAIGRPAYHARRLDFDGDGYEDLLTGHTIHRGGAGGIARGGEALADDARSAAAGDVDGDGRDDAVLGRPYADTSAGPARGALAVIRGRAAGLATDEPAILLHSDSRTRLFGAELAVVGDVDADGFDDLVAVSELAEGDAPQGFVKTLDVRLLRGGEDAPGLSLERSLPLPAEGAAVPLSPRAEPGRWAAQWLAVEALGDVDRDGYDDFAVLERGPEAEPGRSYRVSFFLGGERSLRRSVLPIDPTRAAVFGLGDVDGDGAADTWVDGRILFGGPGFPEGARTFDLPAERLSVAGPGDIDGDGYGDVVVAQGRALRIVFGSSGFAAGREAWLEDVSPAPGPSTLYVLPAWVE